MTVGLAILVALVLVGSVGLSAAPVRAVAVDYGPVLPQRPDNMTVTMAWRYVERNLLAYAALVAEADSQRSSPDEELLVAFCEDCLFGPAFATREAIAPFLETVPPPGSVPSESDSPALFFLSAVAVKYGAYIVVVLGEHDGGRQFNTAVALGPEGAVAARYRKRHLYYEPQFDAGPVDQPERMFDTAFGRVGLCICFDVLFADTMAALQEADVVVSPSWWVNVQPLLTGVAMHSAVARLLNKTLIAPSSGYNWFNSGSAVMDASGRVAAAVYNPTWTAHSQLAQASLSKRRIAVAPSVTEVRAAAGARGTVGDSDCNATFRFSSSVLAGERYGLVHYVGGYAPVRGSAPLFQLSLCAFVRCSLPDSSCISLYTPVPNVTAVSVFDFVQLGRTRIFADGMELWWITDGDFNVRQQCSNTTLAASVVWETTTV